MLNFLIKTFIRDFCVRQLLREKGTCIIHIKQRGNFSAIFPMQMFLCYLKGYFLNFQNFCLQSTSKGVFMAFERESHFFSGHPVQFYKCNSIITLSHVKVLTRDPSSCSTLLHPCLFYLQLKFVQKLDFKIVFLLKLIDIVYHEFPSYICIIF